MKRLHVELLSDRIERGDQVAQVYRKSLLYFVSNALESDLRTPLLGLAQAWNPGYSGWDGTSATGDTLRAWRDAAAAAGLADEGRLVTLDGDQVPVAREPQRRIAASHGSFDNDLDVITRTLERITGGPLAAPLDDLRGY